MADNQLHGDGFATLQELQVSLVSGCLFVPPNQMNETDFLIALDRANEAARLPGLEDAFNPWVLDGSRIFSMLAGLSQQTPGTLESLRNKSWAIGIEKTYLSCASPIDSATIRAGFKLIPQPTDNAVVIVHLEANPEYEDVKQRALRASILAQDLDRLLESNYSDLVVKRFCDRPESLAAIIQYADTIESSIERKLFLKRCRFAAASAWRISAEKLAAMRSSEYLQARRARALANRSTVPTWVGFPGFPGQTPPANQNL